MREKHLTSMCHSNENVDAPNELNSYRVFTSQHASYMILNASHFTNQKAKMSRERERKVDFLLHISILNAIKMMRRNEQCKGTRQ